MSEQVVVIGGAGRAVKPLSEFAMASGQALTSPAIATPTQLGFPVTEAVVTGTFVPKAGLQVLELNHATTPVAITIAAPVKNSYIIITNTSASGTAAHTVTLTAGDWNGAAGNVITLNAPEETLVVYGVSATRYVIIENIGTVGIA